MRYWLWVPYENGIHICLHISDCSLPHNVTTNDMLREVESRTLPRDLFEPRHLCTRSSKWDTLQFICKVTSLMCCRRSTSVQMEHTWLKRIAYFSQNFCRRQEKWLLKKVDIKFRISRYSPLKSAKFLEYFFKTNLMMTSAPRYTPKY